MTEAAAREAVDLIRLVDEAADVSVRVRVLGRHAPGVLPGHDHLDVEFVVESGFVAAQVKDILTRADVSQWSALLGLLAAGHEVAWRDDWRSVELDVTPDPRGAGATVTVADHLSSDIEVCLPMQLPTTWVDDQRALLADVERRYPSEVVEESSLVYRWRAGRPPATSH